MEGKKYFEIVSEKLDQLTDDEFMQLLMDSGLEECPFEVSFDIPVQVKKQSRYELKVDPVKVDCRLELVA